MAPSFHILAAGVLSTLAAASPATRAPVRIPSEADSTSDFITFSDIIPSIDLNWVDCYGPNLQCTYLTVPLDYEDLSAGTTDIAYIRYLVDENLDDLLFNPGGPGESGVEYFSRGTGKNLAKRWAFNPISFDPRGVKWTGPQIACSYEIDSASSRKHRRDAPNKLGNLTEQWDTAFKNNRACSVANEHSGAKYVSSLANVQDMMHFTELQAKARGKDPKSALINYYGGSYGTTIGHTLVASYPDRINRVLLDANTNSVATYTGWEPTTIDGYDQVILQFSKLCSEAGDKWCPLAVNASTPEQVQAKFDHALDMLREKPVEFNGTTYDDFAFMNYLKSFMYFPHSTVDTKGYRRIANATASVLAGDSANAFLYVDDSEVDDGSPKETGWELKIITSADVADRFPFKTYEEWKAAGEKLAGTARYGAKVFVLGYGTMSPGMSIVPPPSQYFPGFRAIKPRASVLFINNMGDHVTPPTGAREMAKLFEGSGVVIVDGPGHGSSSAPSNCTRAIVAEYMKSGVVPKEETVCTPDVKAEYYFGGEAEDWTYE